jgi:hypothetical protein
LHVTGYRALHVTRYSILHVTGYSTSHVTGYSTLHVTGYSTLTYTCTIFYYKSENQENQNKLNLYATYIFIEIF